MEFAAAACNLQQDQNATPDSQNNTYILFVGIDCDMTVVCGILDEVRPPRSEFWVLDLAVL